MTEHAQRKAGRTEASWAAGLPEKVRATGIDLELMRARHGVPAVSARAAAKPGTIFRGAAGAAREDAIFRIFSMTKAVTSVAALQLVERGQLRLDEPAARWLPALGRLEVLEGFDEKTGQPRLRPARAAVTARHLLTHTAGFAYEFTSEALARFVQATGRSGMADLRRGLLEAPLLFDPGAGWHYGTSTDWLGRLVEAVSGQALGDYFRAQIFDPCGMTETGFSIPEEKWGRIAVNFQRGEDGQLWESPFPPPRAPQFSSGGGGLLSTAEDYSRFLAMVLNGGRGERGRVLSPETVEQMGRNQIGALSAGKLKSAMPMFARDADFHPGFEDKFGFGFLLNETAYEGGRSAGSMAWAGAANTYFWVDRARGVQGIVLMQLLPFFDGACTGLFRDFERAVYELL